MANIIVERGWYELAVTWTHADGTVEKRDGGWHKDEMNGRMFVAYREPIKNAKRGPVASFGFTAEDAVKNLMKLEAGE